MQESHPDRWHSLCFLTWRLTGNGLSWFLLWGQRGLHFQPIFFAQWTQNGQPWPPVGLTNAFHCRWKRWRSFAETRMYWWVSGKNCCLTKPRCFLGLKTHSDFQTFILPLSVALFLPSEYHHQLSPLLLLPCFHHYWVASIIQCLWVVFICRGCYGKVDWVVWRQKFIFPQFWRLDLWDQGTSRAGLFWGLSPWLVGDHLCPVFSQHLPSLGVGVLISSSSVVSHIGLGPALVLGHAEVPVVRTVTHKFERTRFSL